jgi:hypothetical protein
MRKVVNQEELKSRLFFYGSLVVFVVLLLWRVPARITHPTFFVDDGTVYFKYAFEHSWWRALFHQHQGYYEFWPNLIGVLAAKVFPIEWAPSVNLIGALAIWGLLAGQVIAPGSPFTSDRSKIAALFLMILVPPSVGRVEIAVAHFYLCVCAALVLVSTAETPRGRMYHRGVLLFCGLSSPVAIFLLPVYIVDYMWSRSRERFIQIMLLIGCVYVQAIALYCSDRFFTRLSDVGSGSVFIFWLFNRSIIHPFLGWDLLRDTGDFFQKLIVKGGEAYIFMLGGCTLVMAEWIALMAGIERPRNRAAVLLTISFVIVSVASYYTGYASGEGKSAMLNDAHRYFFTPAILMAWVFIIHAGSTRTLWLKRVYMALVACMLVTGIYMWFFQTPTLLNYDPDWRAQIIKWRQDPTYRILIAPEGWGFTLNPHAL